MELLYGKNKKNKKTPKIILLVALTLVLLIAISLYNPFCWYTYNNKNNNNNNNNISELLPSYSYDTIFKREKTPKKGEKCDIFSGEWVPKPEAPYYDNTTCWAIHSNQNCMKEGRPDREFLKWRWKPYGCELPIFDPIHFFELVRGKSIAFVGDSVARNHLQSLICLLSRVEFPIEASTTTPKNGDNRLWYKTYNFTIASFWTIHLVKSIKVDPIGPTKDGLYAIYLDEPHERWANHIDEFDYVVISSGHWFERPSMYYENHHLVGCEFCKIENVTHLPKRYGYGRAFRTAFRAINSLKNYRGVTILRTFSPAHFEGGVWNKGGDCVRKRPFRSNEAILQAETLELYRAQVEEFRAAEREGRKRGLKFRLMDTIKPMLLRPDGHPSKYWPQRSFVNDCVHWCLPGPIDSWGDFLLEMLKREEKERKV